MDKKKLALATVLSVTTALNAVPSVTFANTEEVDKQEEIVNEPVLDDEVETTQEAQNEGADSSEIVQEQEPIVSLSQAPVTEFVAQIGDAQYATLQEALDAAKDGDTVTLLSDIEEGTTWNEDSRYSYGIQKKSFTMDGNNHTIHLDGGSRGIFVKGGDTNAENKAITFRHLTITNSKGEGRCIDTRGGYFSLTLDHVNLDTTKGGGNTQALTIGGDHSDGQKNNVSIVNSTLQANDAGYAYIGFNPVKMTIDHSSLNGYASLYFKGKDGSAGSAGSVVNVINGSEISSVNPHEKAENDFGTIVFADQEITLNISDSRINTGSSNKSRQNAFLFTETAGGADEISENCKVDVSGSSSAFVTGTNSAIQKGAGRNNNSIQIQSGTYNSVDVLDFLTPGANVTIQLNDDVTKSITISKDANVTLDLNGHTITNTKGQHTILNQGNLTIIGEGIVDNTSHSRGALVNVDGTGAKAMIKGGEFTRSKEAGISGSAEGNSWYVISNGKSCEMVIENANVHSTGSYSSLVRNYGDMTIKGGTFKNGFITIKSEEGTKLVVEGGAFSSEKEKAFQVYGDTTINNGEIHGNVEICNYDKYPSNATVNGGIIQGNVIVWDDKNASESIQANIQGGTITGDLMVWDHDGKPIEENGKLNIDVSAGTFGKDVTKYVVEGKASVGVDGKYYVGDASNLQKVVNQAQNSVEILKGMNTIEVPKDVTVTNKTGEEIVVNGNVVKDDQPIVADYPSKVQIEGLQDIYAVGDEVVYKVNTKPADMDLNVMVKGYVTGLTPEERQLVDIWYKESKTGEWMPFTTDYFGPESGFPFIETASEFKIKFKKAGTIDFKIEIREINKAKNKNDGAVLATTSKTITIQQPLVSTNTAPTINVQDATITIGDEFDPRRGVTATDKEDGDITHLIKIRSFVNPKKAGVYDVIYTVTDSQGATTTKTIKVTVQEKKQESAEQKNPNTSVRTNIGIVSSLAIISGSLAVFLKRKNKK